MNLYRALGNSPVDRVDPVGLRWMPSEVWEKLTEDQQKKWFKLYEEGWKFYNEKYTWNPLSTVSSKYDSCEIQTFGFDKGWNIKVGVNVTNAVMGQKLANGEDVQWADDGWAVEFDKKLIWIDNKYSSDAAPLIGQIIDALYEGGKVRGWKAYDVDLYGDIKPEKEKLGNTLPVKDSFKKNWANAYALATTDESDKKLFDDLSVSGARKTLTTVAADHYKFFDAAAFLAQVGAGKQGPIKLLKAIFDKPDQ
jgi:hypothetical protein